MRVSAGSKSEPVVTKSFLRLRLPHLLPRQYHASRVGCQERDVSLPMMMTVAPLAKPAALSVPSYQVYSQVLIRENESRMESHIVRLTLVNEGEVPNSSNEFIPFVMPASARGNCWGILELPYDAIFDPSS